MEQFEKYKQEFSREIDKKVDKLIKAHNNSKLKYDIYHKRSALILNLYFNELLICFDFNSVPVNITNELNALNIMSIFLEQVLMGTPLSEVGYTNDGCLVHKDKVEDYNKQLKIFNYYQQKNLNIISYDADTNFEWRCLTDEELMAYDEAVKEVIIPEDAEKLVWQIELLRHTQPIEISLRLLKIRKIGQEKCNLFINKSIIDFLQNVNSNCGNALENNKFEEFIGILKNKINNNVLVRNLKGKKNKF